MKKIEKLKLLKKELEAFSGEVDVSDPEWTHILFSKRVSILIRRGVLRTNKLPRKVLLSEIVESVVGSKESNHILGRAEEADEMLHTYGDGPDKEEMTTALQSLKHVIELLTEIIARPEQSGNG